MLETVIVVVMSGFGVLRVGVVWLVVFFYLKIKNSFASDFKVIIISSKIFFSLIKIVFQNSKLFFQTQNYFFKFKILISRFFSNYFLNNLNNSNSTVKVLAQ